MTDQNPGPGEAPAPVPPPPPPPAKPPRSPVVSVLMVIGGIILLLPGLCSLVFVVLIGGNSANLGPVPLLWLLCFAISAGGIVMIVKAKG